MIDQHETTEFTEPKRKSVWPLLVMAVVLLAIGAGVLALLDQGGVDIEPVETATTELGLVETEAGPDPVRCSRSTRCRSHPQTRRAGRPRVDRPPLSIASSCDHRTGTNRHPRSPATGFRPVPKTKRLERDMPLPNLRWKRTVCRPR